MSMLDEQRFLAVHSSPLLSSYPALIRGYDPRSACLVQRYVNVAQMLSKSWKASHALHYSSAVIEICLLLLIVRLDALNGQTFVTIAVMQNGKALLSPQQRPGTAFHWMLQKFNRNTLLVFSRVPAQLGVICLSLNVRLVGVAYDLA